MSMNKAVVGIVDDRAQVDGILAVLRAEGFPSDQVSVLFPDKETTQTFSHENSTKAPEGTAVGTAGGAVLGGAVGWMIGLGALAIPGVGPFIAAGPIMAALAGATLGGAVGSIAGALIGFGIPEYEAKMYEGFVQEGGILISVHVQDAERAADVKRIFETSRAHDISSTSIDTAPRTHREKLAVKIAEKQVEMRSL